MTKTFFSDMGVKSCQEVPHVSRSMASKNEIDQTVICLVKLGKTVRCPAQANAFIATMSVLLLSRGTKANVLFIVFNV